MNIRLFDLNPDLLNVYLRQILELSEIGCSKGLLALEEEFENCPLFLVNVLQLVTDGHSECLVQSIGQKQLESMIAYLDRSFSLIIEFSDFNGPGTGDQLSDLLYEAFLFSGSETHCDQSLLGLCEILKKLERESDRQLIEEASDISFPVKVFLKFYLKLLRAELEPTLRSALMKSRSTSIISRYINLLNFMLEGVASIHAADHPTLVELKLKAMVSDVEFEKRSLKGFSESQNFSLSQSEVDDLLIGPEE